MRPGCAPFRSIPTPAGTVLQAESASATAAWSADVCVKLPITLMGAPKAEPPSCETLTQIWVGPYRSWYMSTTSAVVVLPPGGMYAAPQGRSTPNGEQLLPQVFVPLAMSMAFVPVIQEAPSSSDFHTSAWKGAVAVVSIRSQMYSALDWSVNTHVSPLVVSATVALVQAAPASVDL